MSIQTGSVQSGGGSGNGQSGLGGLQQQQQSISPPAVVNQSAGETAQHHHHAHDPYTSTYPSYSNIVPYSSPYSAEVNALPPYYPLDPSQHAQPPGSRQAHEEHPNVQGQRPPPNPVQSPGQPLVAQLSPPQGHDVAPVDTAPILSTDSQQRSPIAYQAANAGSPPDPQHRPSPPDPVAVDSPGGPKRAYEGTGAEDDGQHPKRARRATIVGTGDGELEVLKEESEVGPSGGPKHWTDEEKGRLFHWMLDNDERWEAFGTKMNTVFREGSAQLFQSRKSFTALKSCYHRNLEIFKQVYVFEAFLARAPITPVNPAEASDSVPSSSASESPNTHMDYNEIAALPMPASFATATERHNFLERKLEAAKALNVPVSNLTAKVIDHWFDMGWFALFKKRFQEDPKTGLPAPRYAADRDDPDADAEGEEVLDDEQAANGGASAAEARRRHLDPNGCLIPQPFPNPMSNSRSGASIRSHRASPPPSTPAAALTSAQQQSQFSQGSSHYSHSAQSSPQLSYGYPPHGPIHIYSPPNLAAEYQMQQQQLVHFQLQTAQTLSHLTNLVQTLLGTCNTLVELVKAQAEDIRTQTELLRRREEREELAVRGVDRPNVTSGHTVQPEPNPPRVSVGDQMGRDNRATLATEVLANPRVSDEVKHAAAEYLKRLFQ